MDSGVRTKGAKMNFAHTVAWIVCTTDFFFSFSSNWLCFSNNYMKCHRHRTARCYVWRLSSTIMFFFCFIFSCSSMLCKSAAICIFFTLGWQWFCSSSWKMKWKKMKMKCSDVDETKLIIPQRRRRRRDTTFMERKGTLNRRAACTFYSLFSLSSFIQPKVPIDFTWMRE